MAGAALLLTACDKDLDNNPTLKTPTTFTLNTPVYAATTVELAATDSLGFSWSQPDYGFPLQAEYQLEVSLNDSWKVSTDQADENTELTADYTTVGDATPYCQAYVTSSALATALEKLGKWKEGAVPAAQEVYARCYSLVSGDTIYSNSVKFSVTPYYVELSDAAPNYWYLIGGCIGDGKWTNSAAAIGTSIMPFYPVAGQTYDKKTGDGILSWTGYLTTDGFKLIHVPDGSWSEQAGSSDGGTTIVWNDGGSSNICVPENGIYTVTLNTTTKALTIEKYDKTPSVFDAMYLRGTFNSWDTSTPMSKFSTFAGAQNHDWVGKVTITADAGSDEGVKFDTGSWTNNWGASDFPFGTGVAGGANIPYKAGTYLVFFNDITGQYNFIAQ